MNTNTERINFATTKRTRRRLDLLSADQGIPRNDLLNQAINDYLDRLDAQYSAPDLVLDRMNQIFSVLIEHNRLLEELTTQIRGLNHEHL